MSDLVKGCIYYFINNILNKIPSRRIRMFFYHIFSKGNISKKSFVGLGVRMLDIRNIRIGDYSNINFDSILDGRGEGLYIGKNVDIAPQVNIWTMQHQISSGSHLSESCAVHIEDCVWLGNRAMVLPGSSLGVGSVVGAGTVFKGTQKAGVVSIAAKSVTLDRGLRKLNPDFELQSIRRFR